MFDVSYPYRLSPPAPRLPPTAQNHACVLGGSAAILLAGSKESELIPQGTISLFFKPCSTSQIRGIKEHLDFDVRLSWGGGGVKFVQALV